MMKRLALVLILATATISTQAIAHAKLDRSVPADAAEVTAVGDLVLDFSTDVRLTSLVLEKADGEEIPLGKLPAAPAKIFTVEITGELATGEYVVAWRSVSADAHVMSGEFQFTVNGN